MASTEPSECRLCWEAGGCVKHVCRCRGSMASVHVSCLVNYAESQWPDTRAWVRCPTCRAQYSNPTSAELAWAFCARVDAQQAGGFLEVQALRMRGLAEQWAGQCPIVSFNSALFCAQRSLGVHRVTLAITLDLMMAFVQRRFFVQARELGRLVLAHVWDLEPEHGYRVLVHCHFCAALLLLAEGQLLSAHSLLLDTLRAQEALCMDLRLDCLEVIKTRQYLALALSQLGLHEQARTVQESTLRKLEAHYGSEHSYSRSLRCALEKARAASQSLK